MPRQCSVCIREDRESIDVALAAGEVQREIAARFDINPSALWRHSTNHLAAESSEVVLALKSDAKDLVDAGLISDHSIIPQLLAENLAISRGMTDHAILNGKDELALKAIKSSNETLALVEKFTTKHIGESADTELVEDMRSLVMAMRRVLPDHRDAAKALISELKLMGALHLAETLENNVLLINGSVE